MTYIKTLTAPLIIPLIIIAGLALLTACGGGATPAEETAVDCTEAPFDSVDMCEDEKNTACQMHGITEPMGHASCDDRINMACTEDPFVYDGCDTLDDKIRTDFCKMPANIFAHAECMNVSNINDLRKTYCSVTDIFHATCLDNTYGGDDNRDTACQMYGTGAMGHASCDGRIRTACIANPFMYDGCDTLDDTIRDNFCKMPANIFTHMECMDLGNINDIRMTFCTETDIFHMTCLDNTYGGDDERDTACQMHGTNVGAGGHASCDGGNNDIRTACVLNPFEYPGCDTLDDNIRTEFCKMEQHIFTHAKCMNISNINDLRDTYCSDTEIFHASCLDDTYDGDDERDNACLTSPEGSPVHPSCTNRPEVIKTCTADPFLVTTPTNTGCENLATIVSIRDIHCGTSANFEGRCTVNYDDWKDSFNTAPIATPNATRRNEFLNAGDDSLSDALDEVFPDEHAKTAKTLNLGELKGGDATDGVAYFIFEASGQRYHYAGLASGTDLGAPSFQKTGTAVWKGKFNATKLDQATDFELEITFGGTGDVAGSIAAFVPSGDNHFLLTGDYDENGVISGKVNYGAFTTGTRTPTATRVDNGILTGLIGKQGAVGAFLSGTGDKDDITGGTSATDGFAGGFVANPFQGNVSYSDWVSNTTPKATPVIPDNPQTNNLNQFVQTIRNDVIKAAHVGQNFNVNLSSLDGDPADGFSVYHVTATDDYLVGLSSTTSLGVVLERTTGTGSWKGSFVAYEGGVATTTDFELMIDFAERNINTTITGTDYTFTATNFGSANGVINGTVNRGAITGSLQGLIGSDGAVGVFHSDINAMDNGAAVSFAGGFIAASPAFDFDGRVTYADWLDSFSPALASTPTAGTSAFLQATGSTLSTMGLRTSNNVGSIISNTLNLSTAEYENNPLGGDAEDGVAFFEGYSDNTSNFYAGIFDTTNLGPPITASDASATWRGQFQAISTTEVNKDFTLEVTFGGEADAAGSIEALVSTQPGLSYFLEGTFSDRGVITGTSIFGLTPTGNEQRNGVPGVLTGLIGQEGAVGAFHSANSAGGFVARPTP